MSSSHAALAVASDDRKSRLAKLKSLKRKQPEGEVVPPEADRASPSPPEKEVAKLHLSGRNYDPETRGPKLGFEAPPTLGLERPTLEEQAAEVEEDVRKKAAEDAENDKGIDLFKLQPKKPNWDLKRELNKKLEVLNVRTDNAIARMVRERLAAKKAAARKPESAAIDGGDDAGLKGAALVEGIRLREREEEEEERREREEVDLA
ncbi:cwf18 pre-mRNA splicing factor-domain-containing protein [Phialemonium atrogriseum]|uniref:Cwf18 pre-mRNA splicing factor-domain-containing protein n=1 Tax=Phialemonium atrogriseum TaxID=1093897 RepID=A0AAJ0FKK5_9PEZI|nr:cwf18 pre-mRNA splicing factor-domain-containing protein [Phialemonium atrogriseum]KAK1771177.1 cwf18 pre-mRNA splicing factor-domain-containing protein [Phialemonium atrogriseum]